MIRVSETNSYMQNHCVYAQGAQWIERQMTFPSTCPYRKGDYLGTQWSRECCSGVAYLPKTAIVNLPCKTKLSKSYHALPKGKTSIRTQFSICAFHIRNKRLLNKRGSWHVSVWHFSDFLCNNNFNDTHFWWHQNKVSAKWQMVVLPSILLGWKQCEKFPFSHRQGRFVARELDFNSKGE